MGLISHMKTVLGMSIRRRNTSHSGHSAKAQLTNAEFSLTPNQVHRLIDSASPSRDQTIVRLLAETGIRRHEAVNLRVSDINFPLRLLTINNGKGGKQRMIPMTRQLVSDIGALLLMAKSEFVFQSRQSQSLSLRQLNRIVAEAGIKAGISNPNPRCRNITCHLLRHTFSRLWKSSNGSIESLSKILGHSSVKTTWDLYGTESLLDVQRNYDQTISKMFTKLESTT